MEEQLNLPEIKDEPHIALQDNSLPENELKTGKFILKGQYIHDTKTRQ